MSDTAVLEGVVSILAALQAKSRDIHQIYVQRGKENRSIHALERMARPAGIPFQRVDNGVIAAHASGKTHGGVIAMTGPRRFVSLEALLAGRERPFIVMLDGVEDPFNFGAAVRALYAAGADGLVLRPRNWMSAAGIVARSSAGATERLPSAIAETALDAASTFRARGLAVACAMKSRAVSIYEADLNIPLFLVIGGEKRGITRSFVDQADVRLQIPYHRRFPQSLGTASAVAVIAFEVMRQRMQARQAETEPGHQG